MVVFRHWQLKFQTPSLTAAHWGKTSSTTAAQSHHSATTSAVTMVAVP
jgi:hypothetical protein